MLRAHTKIRKISDFDSGKMDEMPTLNCFKYEYFGHWSLLQK
jgi:hypothetical protein